MSKIFIVYGHYSDQSFNAAIRDTFIETAKQQGHSIDCVDLYKENFDPVFRGEEPDKTVIDHRERIKKSDTIVLIAPIWNFRMPAILEGWIDKVLAPPFAFTFKKLWGNYGYPIGNLKDKKAVIFLHLWFSASCNYNFLFKSTDPKIKTGGISHLWY